MSRGVQVSDNAWVDPDMVVAVRPRTDSPSAKSRLILVGGVTQSSVWSPQRVAAALGWVDAVETEMTREQAVRRAGVIQSVVDLHTAEFFPLSMAVEQALVGYELKKA